MQAILCTRYGTPEVLQLQEIATPTPKDNELLIRIHAATVGPADCAFRKGDPFIIRLIYGLNRPRMPLLGSDFAGVVEAVGKAVTQFKPGDRVYGLSPNAAGTHAEYKCVAETDLVVPMPANASYAESAAIADGTALTFLRDVAKIKAGQKVLINGASGAVGTAAVQIAKHFGAVVTGVCSTRNMALVKSLGADQVIDYMVTDFTTTVDQYDIIFDAVGKRSFSQCKGALTRNGVYLTTVPTLGIVGDMLWTGIRGGKKAKFTTAGLIQNRANLNFLKSLYEAGALRPVIDRCYPLAGVPDAHRYVDTERKVGNVIVMVVPSPAA
jgi:NADPH:quinone reductase-like Zn-dependent oxidoreductase